MKILALHNSRLTTQWLAACNSVCALWKMCAHFITQFAHTQLLTLSTTYINVCAVCAVCRLFQVRFKEFTYCLFLSFKLNFNQNKCAHTAHISESRMVADFLLFQSAHTFAHTLRTHPLLSAHTCKIIDPNDKKPWFIDLDSRFTLIGRF